MQMEGCAKAFSANTLFVGSGSCGTEWEKKKEDFHKIIGQYGVLPVAHRRYGRRILPLQRKNDVASQEKEHEGGLKTFGDGQVRFYPWYNAVAYSHGRQAAKNATKNESCLNRMEAARVIHPFESQKEQCHWWVWRKNRWWTNIVKMTSEWWSPFYNHPEIMKEEEKSEVK